MYHSIRICFMCKLQGASRELIRIFDSLDIFERAFVLGNELWDDESSSLLELVRVTQLMFEG